MKSEFYQDYKDRVMPALQKHHGYKNPHQVPRVEKVVINTSIGSQSDVKQALEDAKKRFAEKVEKIKKDETLDDATRTQLLLIAQAEQQRKLEVEEVTINRNKERSIDQSKIESDRSVRAVERGYYAAALLFPPIPAIVLGILVWLMRLKDEYKEIAPSRRAPVKKK